MLPKNTMKIVEFLLRNPAQKYNVNQLAKEIKISVGSAHKILKQLKNKKIAESDKLGNAIFYNLNLKNRETQKICEIALIESKNKALSNNAVAKVYANELEKLTAARAIVLFGSVLTKKEKANDVDVLFIIKNKEDVKKVSDFCLEISKTKTKAVVPLIMTKTDMQNKIKEKNPVIIEVMKTGIVLYGEDTIVEALSDVQN